MTVEQPPKPQPVEAIPKKDTLPLVSLATAAAAVPMMEQAAHGVQPKPEAITALVDNISADLKAQGLPITPEDVQAVRQKAKDTLVSSSSSPSGLTPDVPPHIDVATLPEINLDAYKSAIDDLVRNYGLDTSKWKRISTILAAVSISGNTIAGLQDRLFRTTEGRTSIWDKFVAISHDELHLDQKSPSEFFSGLKDIKGPQAAKVGKLLWEGSWPFLIQPASWFVEDQATKMAGKMFTGERTKLQAAVNNRIADSLFMRKFEFLHDHTSGDMMQIINDGKDSTVDFVDAVYQQLIPLQVAQWAAIGRLGFVSKIDATAALVKKLVLDTRIKSNAKEVQAQRERIVQHLTDVNNKLLATLQGLETARTSGSAESGSDALYQSLAQRDFAEAGGLREKMKQDRALNKIFDVMDFGIPFVSELAQMAYDIHRIPADPKKKIKTAEQMFGHGLDAYFRVSGSQWLQKDLRQSFLQLTDLYVSRIIPDIKDIERLNDLLGPYDALDTPDGLLERARVPVTTLKNFDINVDNLHFKNILHGVSLNIPEGSFVTIKGPSGIGKTTLFRHLVGLYTGEKGAVQYGGVDINGIKKYGDESLYKRVAYANQNPQYFEDMSLRDNLLLWSKKDISNGRIESVLHDLNLDKLIGRLDEKSKHFSGGEMRRIGIARALLKDPKVLFLDEPTANLDAASTAQVMKIIQDLRTKRPDMTVVAVTHDPVFEKFSEKVIDFEKLNVPHSPQSIGDHQILEAVAKPN